MTVVTYLDKLIYAAAAVLHQQLQQLYHIVTKCIYCYTHH